MKPGRILVAVVVAVIAELLLRRMAPDFARYVEVFLLVLAAVARTSSPQNSILAGALLGGIQDAIEGDKIGFNGFAKSLLGFLFASLRTRVLVEHPLAIAAALSAGVLANALVIELLRRVLSQPSGSNPLLGQSLLTALVGVVAASVARYPLAERWRAYQRRRVSL